MFDHKKETIQAAAPSIKVQKMPQEFYGGANPVVMFHDVKKDVAYGQQAPLSRAEQVAFKQTAAVGHNAPLHAANLLLNTKFLILSGIILFVLFAAGAGGYYWFQNRQNINNLPPTVPVSTTIIETPAAPTAVAPTTTPEEATSTAPVATAANALLEFPALGLADSADSDNDGLTDQAEALFKTDPDLPDTDGDSYSDAHEIFYLYNPAGKEPMKLIDAGTVTAYTNPVFNYTLYYPVSWAVGNTKEDYKDILFSTLGGDNIEVLAVEKDASQDFPTWFTQNVPGEQLSNYAPFTTRLGATGWERSDKMVYFIVTPEQVYILAYHTSENKIVNYRIVLNMMARSFALPASADNVMPLETLLPPATTTDFATSTISTPTSTL